MFLDKGDIHDFVREGMQSKLLPLSVSSIIDSVNLIKS
jgi:hypothetical protein